MFYFKDKNPALRSKNLRMPSYLSIEYLFRIYLNSFFSEIRGINPLSKHNQKIYKSWKNLTKQKKDLAIIIANGPSFTNEIFDHILEIRNQVDIFSVNYFCENERSELLIPDFLTLADPEFINPTNTLNIEKNKNLKIYLRKNKSIKICTPGNEEWSQFKPFLVFNNYENFISKNLSPKKPRSYPANVVFNSLSIALEIGYKAIYIVGLDYDYPRRITVDKNNNLFLKQTHHYGTFNENYSHIFGSVSHALHWWSYDYLLFSKFERDNIFNITDSSLIDFFKRINSSDFLNFYPKN